MTDTNEQEGNQNSTNTEEVDVEKDTIGKRIKRLKERNGVTYDKIREGINRRGFDISTRTTIGNWVSADKLSRDKIAALVSYFREECGEDISEEWLELGDDALKAKPYDAELMSRMLDDIYDICQAEGATLPNVKLAKILSQLHPTFATSGYDYERLKYDVLLAADYK